jgi:hypothetical protein
VNTTQGVVVPTGREDRQWSPLTIRHLAEFVRNPGVPIRGCTSDRRRASIEPSRYRTLFDVLPCPNAQGS